MISPMMLVSSCQRCTTPGAKTSIARVIGFKSLTNLEGNNLANESEFLTLDSGNSLAWLADHE